MTTLTFDKLAYIDRLKEAGVDERQARAHAHGLDQALREEIVTKADLKAGLGEIRTEIGAVKSELKGETASLRSAFKGDIASLRSESRGDIASVRSELRGVEAQLKDRFASVEARLSRHDWMLGSVIGLCILILGKLLLPH